VGDKYDAPGSKSFFWYGVVTGRDKRHSDVYAKVKPLTPEERKESTLRDCDDGSILYFPARSELDIVKSVFREQIDAVLSNKPYPDFQFSEEKNIRFGSEVIPEELKAQAQGDPAQLEIAVQASYDINTSKGEEAPERERVVSDLRNFGLQNLVYLARLTGFNGLFHAELTKEPVVKVQRVPVYGFVASHLILSQKVATAEAKAGGLAYKLNEAPKSE
jgi:hypothetical protein